MFKINFTLAMEKNVSLHGQIYCPNSNFWCQLACSGPNHTLKRPIYTIDFLLNVAFTKDIKIFGVMFGGVGRGIALTNRVSNLYHFDIYIMTFSVWYFNQSI